MKLRDRLSSWTALAVFCFGTVPNALGQDLKGLVDRASAGVDSVRQVKEVRMQDTLRPHPWFISTWNGTYFATEEPVQRLLEVPLVSGFVALSGLGSASWKFPQGLAEESPGVHAPFWANSGWERPDDWRMRKGPLPVVDWYGQAAHGRGQDFGVEVSASPKYYQHVWVDFSRLQMAGGLLTEDHFRDRLRAAVWGRDSAHRWRYALNVGVERTLDGAPGGVVDTQPLTEASVWQPNRNLVETRWTQAERDGRSGYVEGLLVQSRWNQGLADTVSRNSLGFGGSGLSVDSIAYSALEVRWTRPDGARWSEPAMRGVSYLDVLPRIRPYWSVGMRYVQAARWANGIWSDVENVPKWSPVGTWTYPGRRHRLRMDVDAAGQSASASYGLQRWRDHGSDPWFEVEGLQRWTLPWEGGVVDHVRRAQVRVRVPGGFTLRGSASSSDPVLTVRSWDDAEPEWAVRPQWAVAQLAWNRKLTLSPAWSVQVNALGQWASSAQLGMAPAYGEAALVYAAAVPNLYPGMRVQLEVRGQGWTGGWQRPVWSAERGLFAWNSAGEPMPAGGLVHLALMVRLGEAQLGVLAQNANQGWVPNTVFMAQNYPVTPATLRWFLRWRMFE